MIFDQRMRTAEMALGVSSPADWTDIPPGWILGLDGVGPSTLNKIRLFLASQNLTLRDDGTPAHWLKRFANTPAAIDATDYRIDIPFTIIVDAQEKQPFTFQGIVADRSHWTSDLRWLASKELIDDRDVSYSIPTVVRSLGESRGDYAIEGFENQCHIERKSLEDAQGTFLGWHERRERFERELEYLSSIEFGAVVIECSISELIRTIGSRGRKTEAENKKSIFRTVQAWEMDYSAKIVFRDSRRMAEIATFRFLERFYKNKKKLAKRADAEAKAELLTI